MTARTPKPGHGKAQWSMTARLCRPPLGFVYPRVKILTVPATKTFWVSHAGPVSLMTGLMAAGSSAVSEDWSHHAPWGGIGSLEVDLVGVEAASCVSALRWGHGLDLIDLEVLPDGVYRLGTFGVCRLGVFGDLAGDGVAGGSAGEGGLDEIRDVDPESGADLIHGRHDVTDHP